MQGKERWQRGGRGRIRREPFSKIPRKNEIELPREQPSFKETISLLKKFLLAPAWQTRHGACLGLKAIITHHALDIEPLLLELLCRERFADYQSDNAVAPVRETAAQLYSLASKNVDPLMYIINESKQWQAKHAGLLSIKYLVARRQIVVEIEKLLPCLDDLDDDVKLQVIEILKYNKEGTKENLAQLLLNLLEEAGLDEMTPACAAALDLLSSMEISTLANRLVHVLLPVLRNHSSKIRKHSLKCLLVILPSIDVKYSRNVLQSCFQIVLLEEDVEILNLLLKEDDFVFSAPSDLLETWAAILATPLGNPFNPKLFYYPDKVEPGSLKSKPPPSHELGFKPVDMMSILEENQIQSRLNTCQFVRRASSEVNRQAVFDKFSKSKHAMHRILYCHLVSNTDTVFHCVDWEECASLLQSFNFERTKYIKAGGNQDLMIKPSEELLDSWKSVQKTKLTFDLALEIWNQRVEAAYGRVNPSHHVTGLIKLVNNCQAYDFLRIDAAKQLATYSFNAPDLSFFSQICSNSVFLKELTPACGSELLLENKKLEEGFQLNNVTPLEFCQMIKAIAEVGQQFASKEKVTNIVARLLKYLKRGDLERIAGEAYARIIQTCKDDNLFTLFVQGPLTEIERTVDRVLRHAVVNTIKSLLETDQAPRFAGVLLPATLARISDRDEAIRTTSTLNFATIIKLMSLDDDSNITESFKTLHEKALQFLQQLGNPKLIPDYNVNVKAELRHYQQDGLNWLAFLNRYGLHGALCDDMGLGKTLQTLAMLSGDHEDRWNLGKQTLMSLIVCPSSLTGHWKHETEHYTELKAVCYTGPLATRRRIQLDQLEAQLVITSYDIVRADIDVFANMFWNYVVLDEGHIIKNSSTKIAQAIKQLTAEHRLVLSGTPIQNNVLELWSLFNFLMPGFLGDEKVFTERYAKPILAAQLDPSILLQDNITTSSNANLDAAESRLHALHKQVLPFILRRMKEDVLKELPEKIIQDYTCEMNSLQKMLIERANTQPSHSLKKHAYMRRLCTHPGFAITESTMADFPELKQESSKYENELVMSPKLLLLRDLLVQCGVGEAECENRVLIFTQQVNTIDLVARLVLSSIENATHLRLDGKMSPEQRFKTVQAFNSDPTIDCLLLTTHVGGLGLNLTCASTVIFVEPDWNPMIDLQAMDRAHRIGQTRTVFVYRLITLGTIEERVMGMQRWKLKVAHTVVSQQNAAMQAVGEDAMLDLFDTKEQEGGVEKGEMEATEMDPEGDYLDQFDVASFVKSHLVKDDQ